MPSLEFIQVGDEKVRPKSSPRNLGVIIDQYLDLTDNVKKICVSCHYHLGNIAKIRRYLSEETSEILVHALNSSKLDNCNSLLYALPKQLLNRLDLYRAPLHALLHYLSGLTISLLSCSSFIGYR